MLELGIVQPASFFVSKPVPIFAINTSSYTEEIHHTKIQITKLPHLLSVGYPERVSRAMSTFAPNEGTRGPLEPLSTNFRPEAVLARLSKCLSDGSAKPYVLT